MNATRVWTSSRRRVAMLALAGAALVTGCGGDDGGAGGGNGGGRANELTVVSYGGNYQDAQRKAYWEPFTRETGIRVREDSPSDNAKLKAMVEAGNVTWDIALVDDSFGHDSDGKWLEPIDYSMIDKSDFLQGYAGKYRVGADVEATVLAYRDDKFGGQAPAGLADFFDTTKFPGKRGAWSYVAGGILEAALIADGVAPQDLYPLDVDRALKKLETIRDDIVWWSEGAQAQELLTSGETPLSLVWTSRAVDARESGGAPVKVQWAQWLTQNGWWVIPKGAPHKAEAMELLDYQTSAKPQAALTKELPYGPTNKHALPLVDDRYKSELPTAHLDDRVVIDSFWWAQNYAEVDKQFQAWLLE